MKHQCMLFVQSLVFESSVQIVNEVFSVGDIDMYVMLLMQHRRFWCKL